MFPPEPLTTDTGFFHHLWPWIEASLKMVHLRGRLILVEAKQAGSHYGLVIGFVAAAIFLALLGYLFSLITAVFALALLIDHRHGWLMVMGGAALVHILGAVILILLAKSRNKIDHFALTKEEFRKDHSNHEHPIH